MVLPFDKVYYISLDKSSGKKRTASLLQQFTDLEIENVPEWIKASDGAQASHRIDNTHRQTKLRRGMVSMSEVGCFESHRIVWKKFLETGLKTCLILEDDALFIDLEAVNEAVLDLEWDYINFGFIRNKASILDNLEVVSDKIHKNLWIGSGMWLTHAYCINQKAAHILLTETETQTGGLDYQITGIQSKFNSFGFMPGLIDQDSTYKFPSQIHHTA